MSVVAESEDTWPLRQLALTSALLCAAYAVIFTVGLLGNASVLAAVCRNPSMRTPTNMFIANLAVADLLVTVLCMPFVLVFNIISGMCKAVAYLQAVSVNASVNSLVAISVDRCLVVNRPMSSMLGVRKTGHWIAATWCLPLFLMFPWLYVFDVRPVEPGSKIMICTDFWKNETSSDLYFIVVNLVMSYVLPLLLISICYGIIFRKIMRRRLPGEGNVDRHRHLHHRSRIQVVKMVLAVTVSFALLWLPLYVIFCVSKFSDVIDTVAEEEQYTTMLLVAQWLAAANSCTNPFIYTYFSDRFRTEFKLLIVSMCGTCARTTPATNNLINDTATPVVNQYGTASTDL